jgi:hypothetical protein
LLDSGKRLSSFSSFDTRSLGESIYHYHEAACVSQLQMNRSN